MKIPGYDLFLKGVEGLYKYRLEYMLVVLKFDLKLRFRKLVKLNYYIGFPDDYKFFSIKENEHFLSN